jgi:hypothetical protein
LTGSLTSADEGFLGQLEPADRDELLRLGSVRRASRRWPFPAARSAHCSSSGRGWGSCCVALAAALSAVTLTVTRPRGRLQI